MKTLKLIALLLPLIFLSSHATADLFQTFSNKVDRKINSEVNKGMDKAIDNSVDSIKKGGDDTKKKEQHSKNKQDTESETE